MAAAEKATYRCRKAELEWVKSDLAKITFELEDARGALRERNNQLAQNGETNHEKCRTEVNTLGRKLRNQRTQVCAITRASVTIEEEDDRDWGLSGGKPEIATIERLTIHETRVVGTVK